MRNISLRDLMLALPQFKNEIEVIHPDNDEVVFAALDAIGFDSRRGIEYIPSNHRDMQGGEGVGFQAVGEYNPDPKFKKYLDTIDRVIVAGMTDISLAKDMAELMGKRFNYNNQDEEVVSRKRPNDPRYYSEQELLDMGYSEGDEVEEYDGEVMENQNSISEQIATLEAVRVMLRGV